MKMDKKGIITFEMMMWIPRIIFLVAVMFAVVILVSSFVTEKVDVQELEANTFANRVLYSPNTISYRDEDTGRVYPGIIDLSKFKTDAEDKLSKSIYYGNNNRKIAAKITLKNLDNSEENLVFYNDAFYKEMKVLVDLGHTEGPGGARSYIKILDVLILEKPDALHKGILILDVIIPNS